MAVAIITRPGLSQHETNSWRYSHRSPPVKDADSPARLLARDLLREALRETVRTPKTGTPRTETALTVDRAPCIPSHRHPGRNGRPEIWTRSTVLAAIRAYVLRTGCVPADPQFRRATTHRLPARWSVQKFWRSLGEAVAEAGFTPVPSRRRPPTRSKGTKAHGPTSH